MPQTWSQYTPPKASPQGVFIFRDKERKGRRVEIGDKELEMASESALLNLLAARWELLHPGHEGRPGQSGRAHILSILGKTDPWYTQVLNSNTHLGIEQWTTLMRVLDDGLIERWIHAQIRKVHKGTK